MFGLFLYSLDILKCPEDIGRHTISAICGEDIWISTDLEDVAAV